MSLASQLRARIVGLVRRRGMLASVARGLQPARLLRRSRFEAEMAEELADHLHRRTEALIVQGLSPEKAGRQARLEFGGIEVQKERCREAWGLRVVDNLQRDLRYSLRSLRRSPSFTLVAVVTLALAIGASVAIFSLVDGLLFRELPVAHPEELAFVSISTPSYPFNGFTLPMFEALRRNQTSFSSLVGFWGDGVFAVDIDGKLSRGDIWGVTGDFYSTLSVRPAAGRLLEVGDVNMGAFRPAMVAVLGYGFWQRHFSGDPSVIGRSIRVENVPFTVVGIAPQGFKAFSLSSEPDVTIPLTAVPVILGESAESIRTRSSLWISAAGRLRRGRTLAQARAELEARWPAIKMANVSALSSAQERRAFLDDAISVSSAATGREWYLRRHFTTPLYVLMAIAVLLLGIACINLAGLMLARASARAQEIALRRALGAARWTIVRQMLIETLMLSLAGTAAAVPLAFASSHAVSAMMLRGYAVPASIDVSPDIRVLGFFALVAAASTLLIGFVPAWRVTRGDSSRTAAGARITSYSIDRLGQWLVGAQLVLSLVLLVTAGLMVRTLDMLGSVYAGTQEQHVITAALTPVLSYTDVEKLPAKSYQPALLDRITAIPGVRRAALAYTRPFWGMEADEPVSRASAGGPPSAALSAAFNAVSPGFFATVGMPLIEGRDFTWHDDVTSPRVAIVSQSLAVALFPGRNALGEQINTGIGSDRHDATVVGIAADRVLYDPKRFNRSLVFIPALQAEAPSSSDDLVMLESTPGAIDGRAIQAAVHSFGHQYVPDLVTAEQSVARALLQERLTARLAEAFGGLVLLLVAIGIYGLMAYLVTRRTREIGIRIALGARWGAVVGSIVGNAIRLTSIGAIVGLGAALATTRFVRSLLFGVGPADPLTLVLVPALLLAVAALAALVPALRAARVDPAVTLRSE